MLAISIVLNCKNDIKMDLLNIGADPKRQQADSFDVPSTICLLAITIR